jgi:hypothetical protein
MEEKSLVGKPELKRGLVVDGMIISKLIAAEQETKKRNKKLKRQKV